jgi:hypothetical protein
MSITCALIYDAVFFQQMSIRPVRTDFVAAILLQMSICHVRIIFMMQHSLNK